MKANRLVLEFNSEVLGNLQHAFPFVGTATMRGALDPLAEKNGAKPLRLYNPTCSDPNFTRMLEDSVEKGSTASEVENYQAPDRWFDPLDGLNTCSKLVQVLGGPEVADTSIAPIRLLLAQELKAIAGLLSECHSEGGRFRVHMDECESTPPELESWIRSLYSDLADDIRYVLKKCGREDLL